MTGDVAIGCVQFRNYRAALHEAVIRSNLNVAVLLIEAGADVVLRDKVSSV